MTDLLYPNPALVPEPAVNITTSGINLWQTGEQYGTYEIPASGIQSISFPSNGMEQIY